MPLPMVHLSIAEEFTLYYEQFSDCAEFYLGTISPDAIHMRANTNHGDKGITHLIKDGKIDVNCVVEFLRDSKGKINYNFLLGYGIHILTDYFWNKTVYERFVCNYNEDLEPIQSIREAYYNDTDSIDVDLFKRNEWRPNVWKLLRKAQVCEVNMILSADEVLKWNLRTLNWFSEFKTSHLNPIRYITHEEVSEFIKNTTKEITNLIETERL